jgi:nitrogen-specific signal transduction histidine kinase
MAIGVSELIAELRKFLAGRGGADDLALSKLAGRTLELAELIQKQGDKIRELEFRLDLRSK